MSIEKLSAIWPEWRMVEKIGEGSFGKVYKIVREEHGVTSFAALKIISIPQSDAELSSIRSDGLDASATRSYFEGIVTDFVNEIKLMVSMKGNSNVVSVEDYKVLEKTDKIGWDIFIRMELLTSFLDYTADKKLTEAEVIKLGQDICSALELCAHRNIIHRDIKPENIFVSAFGDFKVGDFGIARELEKTSGSLSSKGTYNYMAPEVISSKHYDSTVDICSLGLVLYKLLNNNRLPFLDPYAQLIQYQDRKNAIDRRFSGEPLPAPVGASQFLAPVILAACAFNPAQRFQTPTAFKNALGSVIGAAPSPVPPPMPAQQFDANATTAARRAPQAQAVAQQYSDVPNESFGQLKKEKKKMSKAKKVLISIVAVLCVSAIVAGVVFISSLTDPTNKVINALKSGEYNEAILLANDADYNALKGKLESRIDTLVSDFRDGSIEYTDASMELNTIQQMKVSGLSGKLTTAKDTIDNLNASRTAFDTAEDCFNSGKYTEAINLFKQVIIDDPNYESAKQGVSKSTDAYRQQVLATAADYAGQSDYENAVRTLDNALLVITNDSEVTKQLTIYQTNLTDAKRQNALDTAAGYADSNDWVNAIATLNNALRELPDDAALTEQLNKYRTNQSGAIREQAMDIAAGYAGDKDWANAIATINNALRDLPDDSALTDRLSSYRSSYAADSIAKADALVAEGKHDDAITLIDKTLRDVPGNAELIAKKDAINAGKPISLFALEPLNSDNWQYNQGELEDSLGRKYSVTLPYTVIEYGYGEYYINGQYTAISGRIVPHKIFNSFGSTQLRVYADESLVYSSPDISQKTLEFSFNVNITGAEFIKVEVVETDTYWYNLILIMDMILVK